MDINFLFAKGEQLKFELIDIERSYKIMNKIKEVATK
jgi:hypothetical protein